MKYFLTSLFVVILLAGGYAPLVHAQDAGNPPSAVTNPPTPKPKPADPAAPPGQTVVPPSATTAAPGTATGDANPTPPSPRTASDTSYDGIMMKIMSLFAWLLGVAMLTLDNVMYYTVVTMGDYVSHLTAIGTAWRILRDIGNIVLIFGFLAIGITTILDVSWYGGGTKMLPTLLVAAVFLNFSLFISEAMIDGGNLFATEFYTQINGGQAVKPSDYGLSGGSADIHNEGISNAIMRQLGLASIYNAALNSTDSGGTISNVVFKDGSAWYIGFMGIILFLVASFVMFSLAFILIARFVALIFLMVVAPIGFAGLAVPKLESTANQWWSTLFEQVITAPVLLLLLYVALAVITDANFLTGFGVGGTSSAASNNAATAYNGFLSGNLGGFGSVVLSFLVAMGLLVAVTVVAKRMSAFGAGWAMKVGSTLSGAALVASGAGFVGRRTVGALGSGASEKLKGTAFGRSFIGRGITSTLDNRVAKASFDVRNTGLAKAASGVGFDLGKAGGKGGYEADYKARLKTYEAAADSIKPREKTPAEQKAIDDAETAHRLATEAKTNANTARGQASLDHDAKAAELARLEAARAADPQWMANLNNYKKLQDARAAEVASMATLTAAAQKLAAAETTETKAANTKNLTKASIENPITADVNARKRAYADRLENGWGRLPFGGVFQEAAGNVRKTIGKSKEDIENKKILDAIKKATKAADKEEGGGDAAKKEEAH